MVLKNIGQIVSDVAFAGLVVSRKIVAQKLADERNIAPSMVSDLVGRLHPQRIRVRVAEIIVETASTRTFRLVPVDGPFPPFRAGQFVNVYLTVDGVNTSRPYTISSSPTRGGTLDITVRRMTQGFVSHFLCDRVSAGDTLEISGPAGCFHHEPLVDSESLVFLAGGCGVTPFLSMIQQAADRKSNLEMHLLYGNRVPDDVIFKDQVLKLEDGMDNLKVDIVVSEPPDGYDGLTGLMDAEMIRSRVGDVQGKTFFLCGPHAMYDLCLSALRELQVPDRRIKRELSGPLPDITQVKDWPRELSSDRTFTVTVDGKDMGFEAACNEPLLNSLERNGLAVDSLCRSGECGVCRIRLLDGKVFMPETVALRKTDAVFGYIHSCAAYPVSDITIRL